MLRQRPAVNGWWVRTQLDKVNRDPKEVEHLIALKDSSMWAVKICAAWHLQYNDYEVCLLWHVNSLNKIIVYITSQQISHRLYLKKIKQQEENLAQQN